VIVGHSLSIWLLFAAVIAVLLAADLVAARHRARAPTTREAAWWSAAVIAAAGLFCALVWWRDGDTAAAQFAAGYLVELSLSVDNLLVFILVLHYFAVPASLQPTALKWGILGAIVLRAAMIGTGTLLLHEFNWVTYLLGVLLVITGIKMFATPDGQKTAPGNNLVMRTLRRILPVADSFQGGAFFVRTDRRWRATPLLLVVLVIEWTDLVFATDSIPAIFAITRDPFLIYTSNIFAIVGLRALFFLLAGVLDRYGSLRFGVAMILVLVGIKMLASPWIHVSSEITLAGVIGVLATAVGWSAVRELRSGHP
jgi:tellurite resistance protein TerC